MVPDVLTAGRSVVRACRSRVLPWSPFLERRQDIAGWVGEPRDRTILTAVDPLVIGLEALIPLDRHPADGQLVNGLVDVVHGKLRIVNNAGAWSGLG